MSKLGFPIRAVDKDKLLALSVVRDADVPLAAISAHALFSYRCLNFSQGKFRRGANGHGDIGGRGGRSQVRD
jgi:hypothetical protein